MVKLIATILYDLLRICHMFFWLHKVFKLFSRVFWHIFIWQFRVLLGSIIIEATHWLPLKSWTTISTLRSSILPNFPSATQKSPAPICRELGRFQLQELQQWKVSVFRAHPNLQTAPFASIESCQQYAPSNLPCWFVIRRHDQKRRTKVAVFLPRSPWRLLRQSWWICSSRSVSSTWTNSLSWRTSRLLNMSPVFPWSWNTRAAFFCQSRYLLTVFQIPSSPFAVLQLQSVPQLPQPTGLGSDLSPRQTTCHSRSRSSSLWGNRLCRDLHLPKFVRHPPFADWDCTGAPAAPQNHS